MRAMRICKQFSCLLKKNFMESTFLFVFFIWEYIARQDGRRDFVGFLLFIFDGLDLILPFMDTLCISLCGMAYSCALFDNRQLLLGECKNRVHFENLVAWVAKNGET